MGALSVHLHHLAAAEGLVINGEKDKKVIDEKVYESLETVGLVRDHAGRYPHEFSGGQRQRMEIARVLAQDPTIIILDEATSALDSKTEYDVVRAIGDRGITCIVIAHRLSTIRSCDEIILMDNGKIAARGTHKELMETSEQYRTLVTSE